MQALTGGLDKARIDWQAVSLCAAPAFPGCLPRSIALWAAGSARRPAERHCRIVGSVISFIHRHAPLPLYSTQSMVRSSNCSASFTKPSTAARMFLSTSSGAYRFFPAWHRQPAQPVRHCHPVANPQQTGRAAPEKRCPARRKRPHARSSLRAYASSFQSNSIVYFGVFGQGRFFALAQHFSLKSRAICCKLDSTITLRPKGPKGETRYASFCRASHSSRPPP